MCWITNSGAATGPLGRSSTAVQARRQTCSCRSKEAVRRSSGLSTRTVTAAQRSAVGGGEHAAYSRQGLLERAAVSETWNGCIIVCRRAISLRAALGLYVLRPVACL